MPRRLISMLAVLAAMVLVAAVTALILVTRGQADEEVKILGPGETYNVCGVVTYDERGTPIYASSTDEGCPEVLSPQSLKPDSIQLPLTRSRPALAWRRRARDPRAGHTDCSWEPMPPKALDMPCE